MPRKTRQKRKRSKSPPEEDSNGPRKQPRLEENLAPDQAMDLGRAEEANTAEPLTEQMGMSLEDVQLLQNAIYGPNGPQETLQTAPAEEPGMGAAGETPTSPVPTAASQSAPLPVDNQEHDGDIQITGSGRAPPIDLTDVPPSPPLRPLSPLAPGRFRYFRPGRPGPKMRELTYHQGEQEIDWSFDYDFSDEDDVPKSLLNPRDAQDYYGTGLLMLNPDMDLDLDDDRVSLTDLEPLYTRQDDLSEKEGDSERRQAWRRELNDRIAGISKAVAIDTESLLKVGLCMNRIQRIYYNGCLRGAGPLGEELGRPQGAVTDRPFDRPTALRVTKGSRRFKEPVTRLGMHALYRHRDRLREALDGIPVIFKCRFLPAQVGSWVQQDIQNKVRGTMAHCRDGAFASGFEILGPADLQAVARMVRFADDRWKTPAMTMAARIVFSGVGYSEVDEEAEQVSEEVWVV